MRLEVIAVNDASADGTGAVLDRLAAGGALRVVLDDLVVLDGTLYAVAADRRPERPLDAGEGAAPRGAVIQWPLRRLGFQSSSSCTPITWKVRL